MRGCGEASSRAHPLPKTLPASDPGNFEARQCGTARSAMHANTPGGRISTNAQKRTHARAHSALYSAHTGRARAADTSETCHGCKKKGGFELS